MAIYKYCSNVEALVSKCLNKFVCMYVHVVKLCIHIDVLVLVLWIIT